MNPADGTIEVEDDIEPVTADLPAPRVEAANVPATLKPDQLVQLAVEKGADVDQLAKLFELQLRWEENEARKAYIAALANFKANPPAILKTKPGHGKHTYAALDQIVAKTSPALQEHGLSFQWRTLPPSDGAIGVCCVLRHVQGHSEEMSLYGPADTSGHKNDVQAIGSTISYLQRYTLMSMLGLAAADDTDGNTPMTSEHAKAITDVIGEINVFSYAVKWLRWVASTDGAGWKAAADLAADIKHDDLWLARIQSVLEDIPDDYYDKLQASVNQAKADKDGIR